MPASRIDRHIANRELGNKQETEDYWHVVSSWPSSVPAPDSKLICPVVAEEDMVMSGEIATSETLCNRTLPISVTRSTSPGF